MLYIIEYGKVDLPGDINTSECCFVVLHTTGTCKASLLSCQGVLDCLAMCSLLLCYRAFGSA